MTPEEAYQALLRQADPALRAGLKKYRTRVLSLIREELAARSLLRTVDLFSGAGGFTLGAMEAEAGPAAKPAVDLDKLLAEARASSRSKLGKARWRALGQIVSHTQQLAAEPWEHPETRQHLEQDREAWQQRMRTTDFEDKKAVNLLGDTIENSIDSQRQLDTHRGGQGRGTYKLRAAAAGPEIADAYEELWRRVKPLVRTLGTKYPPSPAETEQAAAKARSAPQPPDYWKRDRAVFDALVPGSLVEVGEVTSAWKAYGGDPHQPPKRWRTYRVVEGVDRSPVSISQYEALVELEPVGKGQNAYLISRVGSPSKFQQPWVHLAVKRNKQGSPTSGHWVRLRPGPQAEPLYFASGSNEPGYIRGLDEAGQAIGVAAPYVTRSSLSELERANVPVFVDSGAFSEVEWDETHKRFVKVKDLDWPRVFEVYQHLADALGPQLYVVAPDRVGDQVETLARMAKWAPEIQELHELGVNIIVPVQRGNRGAASGVWREKASKLHNAIADVTSQIRANMTIGAGMEPGTATRGQARFDTPGQTSERAERVRAKQGADEQLAALETRLAHLQALHGQAVTNYKRAEVGFRGMTRMWREALQTLGLREDDPQVIAGIPSKKDATPVEELRVFLSNVQPHGLHFLGLGPKNRRWPDVLAAAQHLAPNTRILHDSAAVPAMVGRASGPGGGPRKLTAAQDRARAEIRDQRFSSPQEADVDYTEMMQDLSWLPAKDRKRIAAEWGAPSGAKGFETWFTGPDGAPAYDDVLAVLVQRYEGRAGAEERKRRSIREVMAPRLNAPGHWLSVETIQAAARAAADCGISKVARSARGFVPAYVRAGTAGRLRKTQVPGTQRTWYVERNNFVQRHRAQLPEDRWPDGWDAERDEPTRRHLALAVWAWSPDPPRLRRWLGRQGYLE